jgi:hypothetical protein
MMVLESVGPYRAELANSHEVLVARKSCPGTERDDNPEHTWDKHVVALENRSSDQGSIPCGSTNYANGRKACAEEPTSVRDSPKVGPVHRQVAAISGRPNHSLADEPLRYHCGRNPEGSYPRSEGSIFMRPCEPNW